MEDSVLFVDHSIQKDKCTDYVLSIQVRLDGFSFDLFYPHEQKNIFRKEHFFAQETNAWEELKTILASQAFFKWNYQRVDISFASPQYTLVPENFYDENKTRELFEVNHCIEENYSLLSQPIFALDAQLLFSIPTTLKELLLDYFPSSTIKHALESIINRSLATWSIGLIHVHLNKNYFDLIVSERQTLNFINNFEYRNMEDLLYYITIVATKLNLKREECSVLISGISSLNENLTEYLFPFFAQVSLLEETN